MEERDVLKLLKSYSKELEYDDIKKTDKTNTIIEYRDSIYAHELNKSKIAKSILETYNNDSEGKIQLNIIGYKKYNSNMGNITVYIPTEGGYINQEYIDIKDIINIEKTKHAISVNDIIPKEYFEFNKRADIYKNTIITLNDYTFLHGNKFDMGSGYPLIGYDCPFGWNGILKVVLEEFEKIYIETGVRINISQIKEKFGEFRIYHSGTDYSYLVTDWATYKSLQTCMVCGSEGYTQNDGWINTLCKKHHKEANKSGYVKVLKEYKEKNLK